MTSLYSSDYKLVILRRRINVKMIISSFYNKGGVNKLLILQFNAYLNRNLTSNCGLNLKQMPPTHPSMPRAVDFTPSRLSSPRFSHSKPANHYQTNSLYNYSKQVARSQVYMRARVKKITVMRAQLTYISRDNFAITIYVSILLIVNFEPDFDPNFESRGVPNQVTKSAV